MTGAGRRDTVVNLERAVITYNSHNEEVAAWAGFAQERAAIYYGRGDERRQAAMERGIQPATLNMLANERTRTLTVADRITFGGAVWNILGIAPDTPRRGEIEVIAVRAA